MLESKIQIFFKLPLNINNYCLSVQANAFLPQGKAKKLALTARYLHSQVPIL
jgi:hypothetical protein